MDDMGRRLQLLQLLQLIIQPKCSLSCEPDMLIFFCFNRPILFYMHGFSIEE